MYRRRGGVALPSVLLLPLSLSLSRRRGSGEPLSRISLILSSSLSPPHTHLSPALKRGARTTKQRRRIAAKAAKGAAVAARRAAKATSKAGAAGRRTAAKGLWGGGGVKGVGFAALAEAAG